MVAEMTGDIEELPDIEDDLAEYGDLDAVLRQGQGVIKRCLTWLTNYSALVYEPKCGGVARSHPMSTAVHMEPK
jgi:hypothetical protein